MSPENTTYPKLLSLTTIQGKAIFEVTNPAESVRANNFGNEAAFTQILLEHLREDDLFFDIGACVGVVTLFAAQKVARVIAFEPDPFYITRLQRNLELNQLANVQVHPWAISSEDGVVKFYTSGVASDNSPSLIPLAYSSSVEVQQRALDQAIQTGELPFPTAIKIDIEGAEYAALCGMQGLLNSEHAPRIIFIEIHPEFLPKFNASIKNVMDVFEGAGYKISYRQRRANQYHLILEKNPDPGSKTSQPTILFIPSNDTHAKWMLPIVAGFPRAGTQGGRGAHTHCLLMTFPDRNERAQETLDSDGIFYYHYAPSLLRYIMPAAIVLGNDWGPDELTLIAEARLLGIPTICIQEGPLLFDPLQNQLGHADYALLQGQVMQKYVTNSQAIVVGNPKYEQLSALLLPSAPRVMINCNFTYGVYEEQRDAWVGAAVRACQELGLEFFVSQHPRDQGVLPEAHRVIRSNAALVPQQLQDSTILLTRFSTLIYEALKMGRQVVYYDPMDEPYPIIKENNNGAIFYAQNFQELKTSLSTACNPLTGHADIVDDFLVAHCGDGAAIQNCIRAIQEISKHHPNIIPADMEAYQTFCDLSAELENQQRLNLNLWNNTLDLRSGNQWLVGQRQGWEDTANARQENIEALQNDVVSLQNNVVSLEKELINWRYLGLSQFLLRYSRRRWGSLKTTLGLQK